MRTTLNIDDALLASAMEFSGVKERGTIMRMALEEFVQRRAELRLASIKGSMPNFGAVAVPRRRLPAG